MGQTLSQIAVNVTANIISEVFFFLLLFLVSWGLIWLFRRRPLRRFFGIHKSKQKKIVIYLSNLNVVPGGAQDAGGIRRSFEGKVVALHEFKTATQIQNLVHFPFPALADKPRFLNKILISDTRIDILSAPQTVEELDHTATIITLGSPAFNSASQHIETVERSHAYFNDGYRSITVRDTISDKTHHGFIERLTYDKKRNRTLFYIAGLSEHGTVGAAYYLKTHWRYLNGKFKPDEGFIIMLEVDHHDYRSAQELWSNANTDRRTVTNTPAIRETEKKQGEKGSSPPIVISAGPYPTHLNAEEIEKMVSPSEPNPQLAPEVPPNSFIRPSGVEVPPTKLETQENQNKTHTDDKPSTAGSATVWETQDDNKTSGVPDDDNNTSTYPKNPRQ